MSRMLVVYYSVSNGNTREIARQMTEYMGGADLAEIQTVQPYVSSYQEIVERGKHSMAVYGFFDEYDFSGQIIISFNAKNGNWLENLGY